MIDTGTAAARERLTAALGVTRWVDEVATLTVFQRSRQWAAPFPKFKKRIPEQIRPDARTNR